MNEEVGGICYSSSKKKPREYKLPWKLFNDALSTLRVIQRKLRISN